MTRFLSLQRANWAAAALLLAAAALLFAQTLASVAAGLVVLALIPLAYLLEGAAQRASVRAAARGAQLFRPCQPLLTVEVLADDDTAYAAQVLPVENAAGYRAVLTAAGYALVNDQGRIVYRLRG